MNAQPDNEDPPLILDLVHQDREQPLAVVELPFQPVISSSNRMSDYLSVESIAAVSAPLLSIISAGSTQESPTICPLVCSLDDIQIGVGERIMITGHTPAEIIETAERCLKRGLPVAIDACDFPISRRALGRRFGAFDVILLDDIAPSRFKRWAFRTRDILGALLALVLLAPLFLVIALLVMFSSPGPIFYRAEVVGRDERAFKWRKFRSMRCADAKENHAWRQAQYQAFMMEGNGSIPDLGMKKVVDLQRVTKIGAILRKHSLDELPQLWDVLRGDMTLVGPRPALPYEHDLFADWQRLRVAGITPGLTGPWQAYGRSRVTFDEMVLIDYCYGRCRSFVLDVRLIIRTIWVMVTGEGGL